ncbi:thermonuclease family protein [Lusitaniella coriacea]|uniref:thermonuclease family protein n=1 Tax=Lusitaniella coriacea TaxID=1983105 RepID=UPI003CF543C9
MGFKFLHSAIQNAIILLCLIGLASCKTSPPPEGQRAIVQRVVSGQTLEVLFPNQKPALIEKVRLLGIDAPDLQQEPWGKAAKNALTKRLGQQATILLESDREPIDPFGRRLAYIWHDGQLVNEELIAQGFVLERSRTPNIKYSQRLSRAQEYARTMGYGIWNPENPLRQTPSAFRSKK